MWPAWFCGSTRGQFGMSVRGQPLYFTVRFIRLLRVYIGIVGIRVVCTQWIITHERSAPQTARVLLFHRAHLITIPPALPVQPHIYVAFLTRASFKPSPSRFASRTFARASCAPCSLLSVSLSLSLLLSELVSLRLYRPLYESPPAAGASLPSTPSTPCASLLHPRSPIRLGPTL